MKTDRKTHIKNKNGVWYIICSNTDGTGGIATMDDKILFGGSLDLAAKAMNLRAQRHAMIVSNLANADTPGYKAFDMMVEESMRQQSGSESHLAMERTNPGHLPTAQANEPAVPPRIVRLPEQDNLRGDGNTVDMDREMARLSSNQLLYRATAQIVAKDFQLLKNVITGGK
jgi:flagellar basal-body rod protein FlgB